MYRGLPLLLSLSNAYNPTTALFCNAYDRNTVRKNRKFAQKFRS